MSPSATPSAEITASPTANVMPTLSASPAPTLIAPLTLGKRSCTGPAQVLTLVQAPEYIANFALSYQTESELTFMSWVHWDNIPTRSVVAAENRPGNPPAPFSDFTTTVQSYYELTGQRWQFSVDPWSELLNSPCADLCTYDIVAQSPDSLWQLTSIWDDDSSLNGVWLMGIGTAERLIDFVPLTYGWQWGTDSSTLLVEYSPVEFGAIALLIELNSDLPSLELPGTQPALDPTFDILLPGYEPGELLALSGSRNREISQAEPILRRYQLADGELSLLTETATTQLRDIFWDEPREEIVYAYADGAKAWFTLGADGPALELPFTAFAEFIPSDIVRGNVPFQLVAIHPELAELAVNLGDNRIYIFGCNPAE
ncbi:MAG: hypothetical protein KDE34_21975 [Anaerolineales bacterium]|nr:hypothetical protein [Anaerolineales bacterium]